MTIISITTVLLNRFLFATVDLSVSVVFICRCCRCRRHVGLFRDSGVRGFQVFRVSASERPRGFGKRSADAKGLGGLRFHP